MLVANKNSQAHEPNILVYSDDSAVREEIIVALGLRPVAELGKANYLQVATEPVVQEKLRSQKFDLVILDAEAAPAGGMGIAKAAKDEIFNCPPILLLIQRPQDAWLATWSRADGVVPRPIDSVVIRQTASALLRKRLALTAK
jgi:DNA-binding response OmpR family regulator